MHLLSGYQEIIRKKGKQDVSSSVLYNKHILYQTIRALLKEQGISGTNSFYLFAMMRSLKGRCWKLYEKHQGIKWSARLSLPVAVVRSSGSMPDPLNDFRETLASYSRSLLL